MDDDELFERLLKRPETYRTLLGDMYGRNTATVIMKRKVLRNIKRGEIGSLRLSGTRGGEILFYHIDKKYTIVISVNHMVFNYFYCLSCKKIDRANVCLIDVYRLENNKWKNVGDEHEIFIGNIVKVV